MAVFPIFLPVLVSVSAVMLIGPRFGSFSDSELVPDPVSTIRNPGVVSFFFFVPMYLGRMAFQRFVDFPYRPGATYLNILMSDYLGWFFLLALGAFLWNRRIRGREPLILYTGYVTFFTVNLTLRAAVDGVLNDSYWTLSELFILPLGQAALLLIFPIALVRADTATGGGWAVLYMIVAPLLAAVPSAYAEHLRPAVAVLCLLIFALATAGAVFRELFQGPRDQPAGDDAVAG